MNLNRALIKHQAKELIKGHVFKLFVISFIVSVCVSIASCVYFGITNTYYISHGYDFFDNDLFDDYYDGYFFGDQYDDSDYFNGFDGDIDGWDFYNFGKTNGSMSVIPAKNEAVPANYSFSFTILNSMSYIPFIITALLSPLEIALLGFFVSFIRGKRYDFDDGLKTVFRNAFKVNYIKKLGVYVLTQALTLVLTLLFIIPGIIFSFSAFFAFEIMCDYPDLSPWQAIMLSKKMVKGNRTELFVLELSFIPWALLCIFIFPIIYVMPYFSTTRALYYENFRLRAIKEGRVTEDDFLSDAQRFAKYSAAGAAPNMNDQYYQPYGAPQQNTYYNPVQQTASPEPQTVSTEVPVSEVHAPEAEVRQETPPEPQVAPETAEPTWDENTEL